MGTTQNTQGNKVVKPNREHRLEARPGKVDTALEVSEVFAQTAKHIGEVANVPGLGIAADIVLSILNRVQDMRDNKDEFNQLAHQCRDLVASIRDAFATALDGASQAHLDGVRKQIRKLDQDISKLLGTLSEIDNFAKLKAKRNLFRRFLYARYDTQTIRQYRDAMRHAHTEFYTRTSVVLRVDMAQVNYKTDQILAAVERLEKKNRPSQVPHLPAPQTASSSTSPTNPFQGWPFEQDKDPFAGLPGRPPHHHSHLSSHSFGQNNSGPNVSVYNSFDNSVHDASRVHVGDVVSTNTYNHGPNNYIDGATVMNFDQSGHYGSPHGHTSPPATQWGQGGYYG